MNAVESRSFHSPEPGAHCNEVAFFVGFSLLSSARQPSAGRRIARQPALGDRTSRCSVCAKYRGLDQLTHHFGNR